MSDAQYSVIRYIPDPGRGERLNIGILLWDEEDFRVELDDKAVERVIRENPLLERDALLYVRPLLREQIATAVTPLPTRVREVLKGQRGFPIDLSEPRFTTVPDDDDMDVTLDRLSRRIVRPKRRGSGGGLNPVEVIEKRIQSLVASNAVSRNHFFGRTRTGVQRQADFFANSGANVALDVLRLAIKQADLIRLRADAEAMKVYDVLSAQANQVKEYVVYCEFAHDKEAEEPNHNARTVMEAQGARIVTNLDEATFALTAAAEASRHG